MSNDFFVIKKVTPNFFADRRSLGITAVARSLLPKSPNSAFAGGSLTPKTLTQLTQLTLSFKRDPNSCPKPKGRSPTYLGISQVT